MQRGFPKTGSGMDVAMASEKQEYTISEELTGIYKKTRDEVPEEAKAAMDAVWAGLQAVASEISRAARGESGIAALNGMDPEEAMKKAEGAAFARLNQVLWQTYYTPDNLPEDEDVLKRFLIEKVNYGRDLDKDEAFLAGLKKCRDDELLYKIAKQAPRRLFFSFGDVAAKHIQSDAYRYAVFCSPISGRRTLIHDLAIERELGELPAVRILLTDPEEENKRKTLYVIRSEALLMLAFLRSYSCRNTAKETLAEIGSAYPHRFFSDLQEEEQNAFVSKWLEEACPYVERLLERDEEVRKQLGPDVRIDSSLLIGYLAACHPDREIRTGYADMIDPELAAYVGAVTEHADIKQLLAGRIRRKDLLDSLPYCDSSHIDLYLIKDTPEKRAAFCREVLRNLSDKDMYEDLRAGMENAGIDVPEDLP